jgi:hypothetical protein
MPGPARPVIGVQEDAPRARSIPPGRLTGPGHVSDSGGNQRAPLSRFQRRSATDRHESVVDWRKVYQAAQPASAAAWCKARNFRTPSTAYSLSAACNACTDTCSSSYSSRVAQGELRSNRTARTTDQGRS